METPKWRGQVSIQQVLAEIRENPDKPFWLCFVRATGKECGALKIVSKMLYGGPRRAATRLRPDTAPVDTRKRALHVEKGTLPCTDYDRNEYLTPLISHIIGYNMYQVIH